MGNTLKFEDLDNGSTGDNSESVKEGFGVNIEVAGKSQTETKTIQCVLDNRGLIKLSFKEGGQLPTVLNGRFTDLKAVKEALSVWKARRAKEFNLDETLTAPYAGGGQNIDSLVDAEFQGSPPAFEEPLDEALVAASADDVDTLTINGKKVVLDAELSA